ncbi:MAG: hypothetical protein Q4F18_10980 [Clostridia bacterium]|nr:hypothetical protein [Clostridia bacterium]
MTAQEILDKLGGQEMVRQYLRGVETDSETDLDARRAMLTAIGSLRSAGVYDVMADAEPDIYAQCCLLLCRMWTDAEDGVSEKILDQYTHLMLQMRYDGRNAADA